MAAAMGGWRRLIIYEPFRSIFYAPQFVAVHGGDFAAEALDVEVLTASAGVTTTAALMAGHSEIALGGIMRSLDVADRGGPFLVHFAEVNSRNGFFLLTRQPRPHFTWTDLVGTTVIDFAEAPTPWQCLLTVLRKHGVDPGSVRIERTRPLPDALAAFRAGHGDFFQTGQPFTEALIADGTAHLAASMGEATGPVPFSSYMTTQRFLRDGRDVLLRFTRALYAARPPGPAGAALVDDRIEMVASDAGTNGGFFASLLQLPRPARVLAERRRGAQSLKAADVLSSPFGGPAPHLLPPLDLQEVWAAGVTYERSRAARMEETKGAEDFYDKVYTAERPELFFKGSASRVSGHNGPIRIR